jgi:hypothetical protein
VSPPAFPGHSPPNEDADKGQGSREWWLFCFV